MSKRAHANIAKSAEVPAACMNTSSILTFQSKTQALSVILGSVSHISDNIFAKKAKIIEDFFSVKLRCVKYNAFSTQLHEV